MGENGTQPHPDIFTPEEAAAYLRLPNRRAVSRRAREYKVRSVKVGHDYIFSREQLEFIRRRMFGLTRAEGRNK